MVTIYKSPWDDLKNIPKGNAVAGWKQSPHHRPDTPDRIASIDAVSGKKYTFAEMERAWSKFATVLVSKYGIRKGDVVCLYGLNTALMQAVHYSILTLGAIVSPVNVMYTAEELAHQFRMVKPKLVYVEPAIMKIAEKGRDLVRAEAPGINLVSYDAILEEIEATISNPNIQPTLPLDIDGTKEIAYLTFSSGTSGLPKGVMTSHYNILSNAIQVCCCLVKELQPKDLAGAFLPMSHIMGLNAFIWTVPYRGQTQVVLRKFDFGLMLKYVIQYQIKQVSLVPPMAHALARHPAVEQILPHLRKTLEKIKIGAAPVSDSTLALIKERLPNVTISQGYGMTESSPVTLSYGWNDDVYDVTSSGWLVPNCEARIVDPETGKDVERGHRGELWVRGPNIMLGYLDNPKATAETLTPDGWLKTGDVAVIDGHQQFYIVDRIKELIKSNGHQVAPAELEALLLTNKAVQDAAVIGIPSDGTELPRAYLVLAPGTSAESILKWFNKQVARHKRLWGGAVVIDEVPKSPSGKILRRFLRDRKDTTAVVGQELAKL